MKFVLLVLVSILSLTFAQETISSGLQLGECWELIPEHVACCGDNICSTDALETCGVCPQDCFCAPNFECNPFASDEYGNHFADERGCAPEGYNSPPIDNGSQDSNPCASIAILFVPLLLCVWKR